MGMHTFLHSCVVHQLMLDILLHMIYIYTQHRSPALVLVMYRFWLKMHLIDVMHDWLTTDRETHDFLLVI